jgi:hypothetical protein
MSALRRICALVTGDVLLVFPLFRAIIFASCSKGKNAQFITFFQMFDAHVPL